MRTTRDSQLASEQRGQAPQAQKAAERKPFTPPKLERNSRLPEITGISGDSLCDIFPFAEECL